MAINISKVLLAQVKDRKSNLIQWATNKGILNDPEIQARIERLNQLIVSFGGDPNSQERVS